MKRIKEFLFKNERGAIVSIAVLGFGVPLLIYGALDLFDRYALRYMRSHGPSQTGIAWHDSTAIPKIVQDLSAFHNSEDLVVKLNDHAKDGQILIGNRDAFRDAVGSFVFVVDKDSVYQVYYSSKKGQFYNIKTAETVSEPSLAHAGKIDIWLRVLRRDSEQAPYTNK